MKRTARYATGSVTFDKRRGTWNFYYYNEDGRRRSKLLGTQQQLPTKSAARKAADRLKQDMAKQQPVRPKEEGPLVSEIIAGYRERRMPKRYSSRRAYESRIKNHVMPKWGQHSILELQACPVEDWIMGLELASRSKGAIRALIHALWKYAIWARLVSKQGNPIDEVEIEGSSLRQKCYQSLTIEEGRAFLDHLTREPFRTIGLVCLCFGLRISEALALRWSAIDCPNRKLHVNQSIVRQRVGKPTTRHSRKPLPIDAEMLSILQAWRQLTQFQAESDWVFASPARLGRLPWSDDQVRREFLKAAKAAGIKLDPEKIFGTHSMRNSFRSWLDATGASLAVQQKLMRHGDIGTTMNVYGDVVTNEMAEAQGKIAALALNSTQTARSDA
jgi:integrase